MEVLQVERQGSQDQLEGIGSVLSAGSRTGRTSADFDIGDSGRGWSLSVLSSGSYIGG